MSKQKRMNGSDLGSLFGGKRTSTPKQLPGFKKKSEHSDTEASASIQEAPHLLNHSETLASPFVEEQTQRVLPEPPTTTTPSTTETMSAFFVESDPATSTELTEKIAPVTSAEPVPETVPVTSVKPVLEAPPLIFTKQQEEIVSATPVMKQQEEIVSAIPVEQTEAAVFVVSTQHNMGRSFAVSEQKTVITPESLASIQEETTVFVQEKSAPTVQAVEKESTMIADISEPSQTQESSLIATEERPSPTRIISAPLVAVPQDVGHQPISVATEPPLINSGAAVRLNSETMMRPNMDVPTPPHPGMGPMAVPSAHQHVFYPGYGMGVPSPAVPSYAHQGHYIPTNGNFHGNGNYVSGHGMAVASHVTHGVPSSSEYYIPPHLGYTWPQSYPFSVHPARGPEPLQNNFYPSPLFTQPAAEPQKSVENITTTALSHSESEPSVESAKITEPSLPHPEQKTDTVAEKSAPIQVIAAEKKASAGAEVVEQEDMGVAESDEDAALSSIGSLASSPTQEWNGPLGRQMNQFANHQQAKWQEAQERMRVLARKRQFGFLAPSALLNLMESVAVLWRQETEERMTSKEMFIEGGLMMVETRLQALRSYGFPEDQLQSLEQKMEQIKSVIYPQNPSFRE